MKKSALKQKADNQTVRLILIIILTVFLGILLGTISYTVYNISQMQSYSNQGNTISIMKIPTSIQVGTRVGMNGDRDVLNFGLNSPGGGGTKYIDINSTTNALVNVYISGNIMDYLSVEKNNFIITSGEFVHLPVNLEIPENAPFGNYTGIITVVLTTP